MKSLRRYAAVFALVLFCGSAAFAGDVKVTYLGNSGFLIESGDHSVLIDALYYAGSAGFAKVPRGELRKIVDATDQYGKVDLILTTHIHPDHFQGRAHEMQLSNNPGATLITVPEIVAEMSVRSGSYQDYSDRVISILPEAGKSETFEFYGINVTVFNFTHGDIDPPIEQIGFLVDIGGLRLLHVADSRATREEILALGLGELGIDIAFLPYWDVHRPYRREIYLDVVKPREIIVTHVPTEDAPVSFFSPADTRGQLLTEIAQRAPYAIVFDEELQSRTFSGGSSSGGAKSDKP